jgi:hypothetical protein
MTLDHSIIADQRPISRPGDEYPHKTVSLNEWLCAGFDFPLSNQIMAGTLQVLFSQERDIHHAILRYAP